MARQKSAEGGKVGLWTPANVVTVIRVVLVPFWLWAAEVAVRASGQEGSRSMGLVALFFVVLSLTDSLDGYLARSRNEVTTFGKFLDPIADKLVVVVALCYLLELGVVPAWVLLVVVAREFLVSGLRMVVASGGVVIAASWLGKWKTATTMLAITGLLVAEALPSEGLGAVLGQVSYVVLMAAVALTAWSGIDYFVKAWPAISEGE